MKPMIKNNGELKAFLLNAFNVALPDVQVCPNHSTPFRAFADAYFCRAPLTVWEASRGFGGKSYLAALLAAVEAATLSCDVIVLGGSQTQSDNVHTYAGQFLSSQKLAGLLEGSPLKRETILTMGNRIRSLAASQTSVRSPHVPRLRLDEADEMDLNLFDASMGIPMGKNGVAQQTVISSTHQYANGTMTEVLKRASARGWPVYRWCYKETQMPHGWLDPQDIEVKRKNVTAAMWSNEYDLQEPNPESRAIDPASVKAMFCEALGSYRGHPGEYIEIEAPARGAKYTTGADWARKVDSTVIVTFRLDVKPMRLVAFERMQRLPWPVMIGKYEERIRRFPGQAAHDGTGLGDVVAGYMTVAAEPVIMVGKTRADLLSGYIALIESGEIEAPMIDAMYAEHLYASQDDVYAGGEGHLPDTISAAALALNRASRRRGPFIIFGDDF